MSITLPGKRRAAVASALFDVPGSRARMRHHLYSVLVAGALLAAAWFVLGALRDKGQLTAAMWRPFTETSTWTTYLLPGLRGTLVAAVLSIVFALVIGMVFGIARLSDHRIIRWGAGALVELFRAVPVLILMWFTFKWFAQEKLFPSENLALAAVVTSLTLYNGSVIAEIVRAGIVSLPSGQTEAAKALGLRKGATMRLILLPQAVTAMLPALVSQMVVALKDSALGYQITYVEIVRSGQQLGAAKANIVPALIVVAIIMIILNSALTWLATRIERRLRSGRRRKGAGVALPSTGVSGAAPGMPLGGKA